MYTQHKALHSFQCLEVRRVGRDKTHAKCGRMTGADTLLCGM